jgi:hypothetical protein
MISLFHYFLTFGVLFPRLLATPWAYNISSIHSFFVDNLNKSDEEASINKKETTWKETAVGYLKNTIPDIPCRKRGKPRKIVLRRVSAPAEIRTSHLSDIEVLSNEPDCWMGQQLLLKSKRILWATQNPALPLHSVLKLTSEYNC